MPITVQAIGVLVAPAKTATNPSAAKRSTGAPSKSSQRVTERRADEKQRRDFAPFEAAAERDRGEEDLPPPARRGGRRPVESWRGC